MGTGILLLGASGAVLAGVAFGPDAVRAYREARERLRRRPRPAAVFDPGRERRAERRARELLLEVAGPEVHAMYEELGFLVVEPDPSAAAPYAYLVYPHRPLVAFDTETGDLLAEYCVDFPDRLEQRFGSRLPDADDVLAKWIGLSSDERGLIAAANMHQPGRQVEPDRARRDLEAGRRWRSRRAPRRPADLAVRRPAAA